MSLRRTGLIFLGPIPSWKVPKEISDLFEVVQDRFNDSRLWAICAACHYSTRQFSAPIVVAIPQLHTVELDWRANGTELWLTGRELWIDAYFDISGNRHLTWQLAQQATKEGIAFEIYRTDLMSCEEISYARIVQTSSGRNFRQVLNYSLRLSLRPIAQDRELPECWRQAEARAASFAATPPPAIIAEFEGPSGPADGSSSSSSGG